MKLISEEVASAEYLIEEKNGKKEYKIKGVFLQSNIKNRNGRVYPREILVREVNRYTKEFINKNRAFGELGHPDGPTVNLERVCHMVKSLTQDGKDFKRSYRRGCSIRSIKSWYGVFNTKKRRKLRKRRFLLSYGR